MLTSLRAAGAQLRATRQRHFSNIFKLAKEPHLCLYANWGSYVIANIQGSTNLDMKKGPSCMPKG